MSLFSQTTQMTPTQRIAQSIGQGDPWMDIGKALGLGLHGMFGSPYVSKRQQQIQFMQTIDQDIDWNNPQSIAQASQAAMNAGYTDLAGNLYEKSITTKTSLSDIRSSQLITEGLQDVQAQEYLSTIPTLTTQDEYKETLKEMRKRGLSGTGVYRDLQQTFTTLRKEETAAEKEERRRIEAEKKEAKRQAELEAKIGRGEEKVAEQIRQFTVREEAKEARAEKREQEKAEAEQYSPIIDQALAAEPSGTFLMKVPPQNVDDEEVVVLQRAMGADFKKYDNILSNERGVTPSVAQQYYPLIREEAYDPGFGFGPFGEKASYSSLKFGQIADGIFGRGGGSVGGDTAIRLAKKGGLIVGVSRIKDDNGKVTILDQHLYNYLKGLK